MKYLVEGIILLVFLALFIRGAWAYHKWQKTKKTIKEKHSRPFGGNQKND